MMKGNKLLYYSNLFSSKKHEKNDKVVLNYFQ